MTNEASLPYACEHCSGPAAVSQAIVDGRLHWYRSHACPGGRETELACGRDEAPPPIRRALLEQHGTYRLVIEPGANRVAAMRVLRASGVPLAEVPATLAAGPAGTETEMLLLSERFAASGVRAVVEAPGRRTPSR